MLEPPPGRTSASATVSAAVSVVAAVLELSLDESCVVVDVDVLPHPPRSDTTITALTNTLNTFFFIVISLSFKNFSLVS
jgi:hypothetical protein